MRSDETGRNAAYDGIAVQRRARGCMAEVVVTLQRIQFELIVGLPDKYAVSTIRTLRDCVLMRIIHNVFEVEGIDFMRLHVVLDSAREQHAEATTNVLGLPPRIVEVNGKFEFRCAGERPQLCSGFGSAFVVWYNHSHAAKDPLEIISTKATKDPLAELVL